LNGIVWVRILIGAVWLNGAVEKLLNPQFPRQFAQSLQAGGFVTQDPECFRAFMEGVVVPNAESFAQGVRLVELSLGVTLILGVLTNRAAIASVGQSLSIMLPRGRGFRHRARRPRVSQLRLARSPALAVHPL
jgi:thiosulfate dehydrogenase (quinone) large subunit